MRKVLFSLLIILMVILISGCGKENNLIGTYRMIEMKSDGQMYSKSLIDTLGIDFTLEMKKYNKATLVMGNETLELTYDNEKLVSKNILNNEEDVFKYIVDENRITLNYNDELMTFEKDN